MVFQTPKFDCSCIASQQTGFSWLLEPQDLRNHIWNLLIWVVVYCLIVCLKLHEVIVSLLSCVIAPTHEENAPTAVVTNWEVLASAVKGKGWEDVWLLDQSGILFTQTANISHWQTLRYAFLTIEQTLLRFSLHTTHTRWRLRLALYWCQCIFADSVQDQPYTLFDAWICGFGWCISQSSWTFQWGFFKIWSMRKNFDHWRIRHWR